MGGRMASRKADGSNFDHWTLSAVWNKATPVDGYDPDLYRKDRCGAWIALRQYSMTTELGWEVDHIYPRAYGGSDDLDNLQPLHWTNNRAKGDSTGRWYCATCG